MQGKKISLPLLLRGVPSFLPTLECLSIYSQFEVAQRHPTKTTTKKKITGEKDERLIIHLSNLNRTPTQTPVLCTRVFFSGQSFHLLPLRKRTWDLSTYWWEGRRLGNKEVEPRSKEVDILPLLLWTGGGREVRRHSNSALVCTLSGNSYFGKRKEKNWKLSNFFSPG